MSDESSVRAAGGPSVPRWVQIVDAGALASVALAGCIAVGSGVRSDLFGGRITIPAQRGRSSAAAFLVLVRHWWFRRPSLVDRIVTLLRDEAIATGLTTAVVTRLLVYAIGLYAVFALGYSVKPLPFVVSDTAIGNLQGRWDAGWYLTITRDGYRFDPNYHRQQNIAFFPAYPWLVRLGGPIFGRSDRDVMTAGTVLSFIAFSLALVRLYRLVKELPAAEHRPDAARAAVLLVAVYPFAVFFGAVYTESLFLLCAVSAFLYAERGRWDLGGTVGIARRTRAPERCLSVRAACLDGHRGTSHGVAWLVALGRCASRRGRHARAGSRDLLRLHVLADWQSAAVDADARRLGTAFHRDTVADDSDALHLVVRRRRVCTRGDGQRTEPRRSRVSRCCCSSPSHDGWALPTACSSSRTCCRR